MGKAPAGVATAWWPWRPSRSPSIEHLAAVEKDLEQRGVPADIVGKCFLGLHRCDELPLEVWIGMITDAYNFATAIAAAHSYDAVPGQVQAERRM